MAQSSHNGAFVVGIVLGGLAAATVAVWRAPQAGGRTRAQIAEGVENMLFHALGMDKPRAYRPPDDENSALVEKPAVILKPAGEDTVVASGPTHPLGQAMDIVVDGPRSSELAR